MNFSDNAVERLYLFVSHVTYLILAMVLCAFLQISVPGRLALFLLVPMNLFVAIQQDPQQAFSFIGMTAILASFITGIYLSLCSYLIFDSSSFRKQLKN